MSCNEKKQYTWVGYNKWISKHQNLITKDRVISDVTITVKYLPPELSAYRDLKYMNDLGNQSLFDSLKYLYGCGLQFQLILEADPAKNNLLFYKTMDQTDFKIRIETLSFKADEFISMEHGGEEVYPVLFQYEGYNELANRITIHCAFAPTWYKCSFSELSNQKITIVFKDPYWDTGTNRFSFDSDQLKKIPSLIL